MASGKAPHHQVFASIRRCCGAGVCGLSIAGGLAPSGSPPCGEMPGRAEEVDPANYKSGRTAAAVARCQEKRRIRAYCR
ncbi:hypothetical protein SJ05684_c05470 [Sinorhizobium sojae CCBAU 05684]|uniref:Uncharacterized protein n=1 Tax=Sinorhizobium sojae CCBAU 05684 TaxID=716928 RepID=A0A249P7W0_9HYPH|nr:hypothetical protein SJ05684_c05470 [Sinorhizobium sojae CCBAU 05684]